MESMFLLTIIMIGIYFLTKTSYAKGFIGEFWMNIILAKMLDKNQYMLIKNILLPTENGSTQIDHIVLSEYGIFVIETKNISHWIFSNIGPYWTQVIYKKQFKFQNPTRQNYKHIKTLENIIGIKEKEMKNIVVFTGDCTFKTDVPEGVVKIENIVKYIESFTEKIIPKSKLNKYKESIDDAKIKNNIISKIKHILHVKSIKNKNQTIKSRINIYKTIAIPAISIFFILAVLSLLGSLFNQSKKTFDDIVKSNKVNVLKKEKSEIASKNNTNNETLKYPIQKNYETVRIEKNNTNKNVLYSWKNERGQKVFSNKGFPENGNYTEGKMEWY